MLQALGGGLISKDLAMRELPFGVNVTQEQEKIEIERMRDSLLGALQAYTQAIPQMAVQGGDPTDIVRKVAEVIKARQNGKQVEDVISEIFAPEQQVPSAGAGSPVEQPSPAPVPPAEGALPAPMAAPEGQPDIQTILASLSGSGATGGRATTVSRRNVG